MKFNQLRDFVTVVDCGSINKAAETLFITQPSLSRSVQSLEEEVGKKLLERTNHGVTTTPTGRILYYYAQSILKQLKSLERLKDLEEEVIYSKLSVSVDSIFLKDNLILKCYEKLQTNETEIKINETTAEEVFNDIHTSKSEIGIIMLTSQQLQFFRKMAEIKNVDIEILGTGPLCIHIAKSNPLAIKSELKFSELLDSTYIRLPADFFSDLNQSILIDNIQLSSFPHILIMSNYHAVLNIIKNTNSFIIGHKWQVEELKHSKIESIPLVDCDIEKHFVIIRRKNEALSTAGNIFLNIIYDTYKKM